MNILPVSESPGRRDANDQWPPLSQERSSWIVCAGATRDGSHGRVICPQWGSIGAVECLACHLLEAVSDERDPRLACSTGE